MEKRRKEVGAKIKQGRRLAKYRSQEAFAKAVGYNETTVGNAERGSDRIGDAVYEAIEAVLGWPIGSTVAYIAGTTGVAPWGHAEPAPPPPAKALPPVLSDEEILAADSRALAFWFIQLVDAYGQKTAEDQLFRALDVRKKARAAESGTLAADA